jgi:hypothetical protein
MHHVEASLRACLFRATTGVGPADSAKLNYYLVLARI